MSDQLAMAVDAANAASRESETFYGAVIYLRRAGFKVYRQGNHHKIDGKRLTAERALWFAKQKGWQG